MAVNWSKARTAYITGTAGYREIARKFKASPREVERHGKADGWVEARRQYRGNVAASALARAHAQDVERLTSLRTAGAAVCDKLDEIMRQTDELYTHVAVVGVAKGVSVLHEERMQSVDSRKLRDIAESIKTMTMAMRNLYDIQTAAERQQLEIAREKHAAEQRKEALEDGGKEVIVQWAEDAQEAAQ